ncbi:2394_t:CDS:2 [Rhizophagus irregularis]|nr:2394_t:CDS:2 [Rhizophagus irregularis]
MPLKEIDDDNGTLELTNMKVIGDRTASSNNQAKGLKKSRVLSVVPLMTLKTNSNREFLTIYCRRPAYKQAVEKYGDAIPEEILADNGSVSASTITVSRRKAQIKITEEGFHAIIRGKYRRDAISSITLDGDTGNVDVTTENAKLKELRSWNRISVNHKLKWLTMKLSPLLPSCVSKKTIKDRETDEFLDSEHKKKKIPVKSNQDDQTNASEAQANTSISAKESVSTESRLPELNPKEPFIIKINRI